MRAPTSDLPLLLKDVSLDAGDTPILRHLNLTITRGAPTLIVGPNGSGKTSLLRLCMGLARPSAGSITWGGRADSGPVRRAIVFQRPVMLRRSVAANVGYALAQAGVPRKARAERVANLLDRVGLADLAERPARRLSGGEQQRLALARALARKPEILLLDEPTASLDPAAAADVERVIGEIAAAGTAIVLTTHHLGFARRAASEIVFLHRGRVTERTPAAEFFSSPRSLEAAAYLKGELP
jgi:tungstate transport system ATP-binding protein